MRGRNSQGPTHPKRVGEFSIRALRGAAARRAELALARLRGMADRKPPLPLTPGTWALGAALDQSAPLTRLLQRLQESQARFAALQDLLPEALRAAVRPGPLDDSGWTLLVPGGAAASKLRQLLPALESELQARGHAPLPIRVRVRSA